MNSSPSSGLIAHSTAGYSMMCTTPEKPSTRNQTAVIGPNMIETLAVPNRCTKNTPTMMTRVMGTTQRAIPGCTNCTPSTADSTEMAGVIMASPKNMAAPSTPRMVIQTGGLVKVLRASAISDSVPPSPLLSARVTKNTYLTATVRVSAQTISDSSPSTSVVVAVAPGRTCMAWRKA